MSKNSTSLWGRAPQALSDGSSGSSGSSGSGILGFAASHIDDLAKPPAAADTDAGAKTSGFLSRSEQAVAAPNGPVDETTEGDGGQLLGSTAKRKDARRRLLGGQY